jgi:hypothetical protein
VARKWARGSRSSARAGAAAQVTLVSGGAAWLQEFLPSTNPCSRANFPPLGKLGVGVRRGSPLHGAQARSLNRKATTEIHTDGPTYTRAHRPTHAPGTRTHVLSERTRTVRYPNSSRGSATGRSGSLCCSGWGKGANRDRQRGRAGWDAPGGSCFPGASLQVKTKT